MGSKVGNSKEGRNKNGTFGGGQKHAQPIELINHMLARKYGLSEQHIKMLSIYFNNGLNMTDAYIRAFDKTTDPAKRVMMGVSAARMFKSQRIQNYLTESMTEANKKIGLITIDEVVSELVTILKKEDARDQDKIKAGELLLKHLNAFESHNKAKAPKQLVIQTVEKLSEQQIIEELKRLSDPSNNARPEQTIDAHREEEEESNVDDIDIEIID